MYLHPALMEMGQAYRFSDPVRIEKAKVSREDDHVLQAVFTHGDLRFKNADTGELCFYGKPVEGKRASGKDELCECEFTILPDSGLKFELQP